MKTILVVNNDFDTMSFLESWLRKKGYEAQFTGNHGEVISILKESPPSLIIIDILRGPLVLDIRSRREFADIPLLLMTGYTSKPVDKNLPVDDFIEKPFNLTLLEKKIKRLLDNSMHA